MDGHEREIKEKIKETLREATPIHSRNPYQILERIKTPEDIESAISEIFNSFELLKKQWGKYDGRRVYSMASFSMMFAGAIAFKTMAATAIFMLGAMAAAFVFTKAHNSAFPIGIEIKAYEGVLLKLYEMKILHQQLRKPSN